MDLEEKKVLLSRNPVTLLREWRSKEWWYSGAYEPDGGAYISWYFVRVNFADQFTLTVFDPDVGVAQQLSKLMWLDRARPPGRLALSYNSGGLHIGYTGSAESGWRFELSGNGFEADLEIRRTTEAFTKFDNAFIDDYGLVHFFGNLARGTVRSPTKAYELNDARVYYDHCFGRVPARTGWHWLAVQNHDVALSSLVNYGPYAQRYTQAWFSDRAGSPRTNEWVRLEQSVSFERRTPGDWTRPWRVTSSDLDLEVRLILHKTNRTHIPPLTRFLVDLNHTEVFVEAAGRIRVDGTWVAVENLFGVMEEHHGRW